MAVQEKELPPPTRPEPWDAGSALGVRLSYFISQHSDAFWTAVNQGSGDLEVVFDKVGLVRVQATLLPDGSTHCSWGEWNPYDPHKGKRPYEAPTYDPGGSTSLVMSTSLVEQEARSLIFSLDDAGNSFLVWPTDRVPTEAEAVQMQNNPSFPKIPVGIGARPKVYMYYWSSR